MMRHSLSRAGHAAARLFRVQDFPYLAAALITGLAAVGYAELFAEAEKVARKLAVSGTSWVFLVLPGAFVLSWWVVHRFAPEARGSGIPQVMAAIEALEHSERPRSVEKLVGVRTAVVKIVSSLIAVLGGGSVGREGPTVQIAASVFHASERFSAKFSRQQGQEFWLVTGGAAGIAAAFNTPLGGMVYAIEELATSHFNRFKTSLIAAVIISGMAAQWILGSYLYLGFPKIRDVSIAVLPWALLVGAAGGVSGAVFGKVLLGIIRFKKSFKGPYRQAGFALVLGLLAATMVFLEPRAVGSGRDMVSELLFNTSADGDWKLAATRFLAPILSYSAGGAGGIFSPSLAAGGALGAFLANVVDTPNVVLCILCGMIAFLTGVTRAPFTAFVLVLEMTDRHSAIFPMMLSALLASWASRLVDTRSFYDHVKADYAEPAGRAL